MAGGAGEPAFSPDGSELAFIGHGAGSTDTWRLFVMPSGGGAAELGADARPVGTTRPSGRRTARRSPSSACPTRRQLRPLRRRPDGGDAVQLTKGPGSSVQPAWSPDGEELAFTRITGADATSQADLYVVGSGGGK